MKKNKVLIIVGPTAVGKTALVQECLSNRCEIISADSKQVYQYMDIGTAKPSLEEQARVPHHLIDIRLPSQTYSVADFVRDARMKALDLLEKDKVPIVVGGTGFYIYNLLYGLPQTPAVTQSVRDRVQALFERQGKDGLYAELLEKDALAASSLHPNDVYRIKRALEVLYQTSSSISSFQRNATIDLPFEVLLLGLERERDVLYQRIDARVDQMIDNGLYEEFLSLLDKGFNENDAGLKAIGYQEFFDIVNDNASLDTVRTTIQKNSRHYAKRQMTFFKRLKSLVPVHADDTDQIQILIESFLKQ